MNVASREAVEIVEVGPRDGLQSEKTFFPTAKKIEYITRAVDAGIRRLEVVSFVNPVRVPQMADAEAVIAGLPERDDVTYIGLVFNVRGVQRAAGTKIREINFGLPATTTFCQRNQNSSVLESLANFAEVAAAARAEGIRPTLIIGLSFGCPFEGEVPLERLLELVSRAMEYDPAEISLGDTIGVAVPTEVTRRVEAVRALVGDIPLRCHFHNTRNTGLANAVAAIAAGAKALDSSLGGIGGCPFAPRATGNIPTEDLLYLLQRMGVAPDVDLHALIDTVNWLEQQLGCTVPGMLAKAGGFPKDKVLLPLQ